MSQVKKEAPDAAERGTAEDGTAKDRTEAGLDGGVDGRAPITGPPPSRPRGGKRAEKARQTRRRIVEAAREQFLARGYGATTLQEIAAGAGVAVQTVYFVFGNKRALLKELVDVTIAGDDEPVATMDRAWFRDALAVPTAADHLRAHVAGTGVVLHRVAAISAMLAAAAAADPDVSTLWPTREDPRYTVQHTAAASLVTKPGARPGITADEAADLLYGLLSTELYLLFVRERGWTPDRWEAWAYTTLHDRLCEPGERRGG
ncbi:TetR/AcrR family transcriptional regulator [Embleya sp. AB8]|uniref:TetR/AcrR family transcriptional regulator n=1 Tax=Embleya sp. AB8 TaxID=3156304 RepID=UPI003C72239E